MVAFNFHKVEHRDLYPDLPVASYRRNSLVAGLRVVAAAAWVRFPVSAVSFCFGYIIVRQSTKKNVKLEGFEPPTFGSGIQRAAIAP